jgi:hypothetical protein
MPNQINRIKIIDRDFLVDDETLYHLEMSQKKRVNAELVIFDNVVGRLYTVTVTNGKFQSYRKGV